MTELGFSVSRSARRRIVFGWTLTALAAASLSLGVQRFS